MKRLLFAAMESSAGDAMFASLLSQPWTNVAAPTELWEGSIRVEPTLNWKEVLAHAPNEARARWVETGTFNIELSVVTRRRNNQIQFYRPNVFDSVGSAIDELEPLPFELCSIGTLWSEAWIDVDYPTWGFGRSHLSHGWGCAFRGAGHDRLVSRRWLDFGPWRVIRRPNDTTFIQFHDLAITDPAEAYAQAAPGHERMGNSATGGYLQHQLDWIIGDDVPGLYFDQTRTLEVVVAPAIAVSQEDMLSYCALRLKHRLTPPTTGRVERIAYVFMERADAEAHLHELWLRELECWYVDGRGKHRLDLDYHPVPNPPAWVGALDGK